MKAKLVFTARNSSCRKVLFSQVCVIPSVHRGVVRGEGGVHGNGGMRAGETATEAGGMHPTGMHSCFQNYLG